MVEIDTRSESITVLHETIHTPLAIFTRRFCLEQLDANCKYVFGLETGKDFLGSIDYVPGSRKTLYRL